MADDNGDVFEVIEDVVKSKEPIANARGWASPVWLRWFSVLRGAINRNFSSIGSNDLSQSLPGRIEALEEEIKTLRLQVRQLETEASVVAAELAPLREMDNSETVAAAAAIDDLLQRISVLETIREQPAFTASVDQISEQVVPLLLDADPRAELGQLFKSRLSVQRITPKQMYLPVTQPAVGTGGLPNVYETAVNGPAWECWEFAPGTLAADNDNVEFIVTPPPGWDGSPIAARAIWSHPATATNFQVAWRFQAAQYIDAGSGSAALSSESGNVVLDTGGTTDAVYISGSTSVTPANLAPTDAGFTWSPILWRVGRRNNSEGGTGLAVNARLIAVVLIWVIRPQGQI